MNSQWHGNRDRARNDGLLDSTHIRRYFGSSLASVAPGCQPVPVCFRPVGCCTSSFVLASPAAGRNKSLPLISSVHWLGRKDMHAFGSKSIISGGGVCESCTPSTKCAWCLTLLPPCGTSEEDPPGEAVGSRVANPRVANPRASGSRAAGRANSAPLASRSSEASAARQFMAIQAGVDDDVREFSPEDSIPEEVGNLVREGSSSRSLAMQIQSALAVGKTVCFHTHNLRPLSVAMLRAQFAAAGSSSGAVVIEDID